MFSQTKLTSGNIFVYASFMYSVAENQIKETKLHLKLNETYVYSFFL